MHWLLFILIVWDVHEDVGRVFPEKMFRWEQGRILFLKGVTVYWWYRCNFQSLMYAIIAMYFGKNLTLFSYMFSIHGLKTLCMVLTNSNLLKRENFWKFESIFKSIIIKVSMEISKAKLRISPKSNEADWVIKEANRT